MGGTRSQVRTTLKRLQGEGRVWSHTLQGFKTSGEYLQHDAKLWDLSDLRTKLDPSAFDDVVVAELTRRPLADLTPTQIWLEVGGSALDVRASLDRLGDRVSHVSQGRNDYWSMSVEEMLAPAGLRAIYEVLNWDFQGTMKIKKVLEEGLYGAAGGALRHSRARQKRVCRSTSADNSDHPMLHLMFEKARKR